MHNFKGKCIIKVDLPHTFLFTIVVISSIADLSIKIKKCIEHYQMAKTKDFVTALNVSN